MKQRRRNLFISFIVIFLGFLLFSYQFSPGYEYNGVHWNSEDIPVPYYINTQNSGVSASDMINAIIDGTQVWNDVSNCPFEFEYQGLTSTDTTSGDNINVWGWNPTGDGMGSETLAITEYRYYESNGELVECDVTFNGTVDFVWDPNPGINQYDLQNTVTHEAGHWLNLGHSSDSNAIMYPVYTNQRELGQDDINGIMYIYTGATPTNTNTGGGSSGGGGGGGCFIATAAYGSYLDPHVMVLRKFRDDVLQKSSWGRSFIAFYYKNSPPVARVISHNETLRGMTRLCLTPVIFAVKHPAIFIIVMSGLILIFGFITGKISRKKMNQGYSNP